MTYIVTTVIGLAIGSVIDLILVGVFALIIVFIVGGLQIYFLIVLYSLKCEIEENGQDGGRGYA
jgi:hypothetical protein